MKKELFYLFPMVVIIAHKDTLVPFFLCLSKGFEEERKKEKKKRERRKTQEGSLKWVLQGSV